jgi:alkyl hydroperoxide reductase subunit AhpC
MTIHLGDLAPDFYAETTEGPIEFLKWKAGTWAVLFSHPADYTPVCTTELGRVASLHHEFAKRNVKVIALSVDPLSHHLAWMRDIDEVTGHAVNFPLIADADRRIAYLYDMIHPGSGTITTVRSVFIIGPDDRIKVTINYPANVGRNFTELLRVIDALQTAEANLVVTPADWNDGDEVIIAPEVTDDLARKRFPSFVTKKPYLRVTKLPPK